MVPPSMTNSVPTIAEAEQAPADQFGAGVRGGADGDEPQCDDGGT
jgi:hypothetical protein